MDYPRLCPARWLFDQDFSRCLNPYDVHPYYDIPQHYYRPWRWHNQSISKECSSTSTIENEKGSYIVTLDVQHFRLNEISVKVSDREIIVEGRHEERPDTHGFIMRQFKRRYTLPDHYASETVTSTMSSDGVLTIRAEKQSSRIAEKIIPIKLCSVCPKKTETASTSQKVTTNTSSSVAETSHKSEKTKGNEKAKSQTQIMLREEACCLIRPEILKVISSETRQENVAIQDEKMAVKDEKLAFKEEKIAARDEEMAVRDEKMAVKNEKMAIKDEKMTFKDKKMASKDLKRAVKEENMTFKDEKMAVKEEKMAMKEKTATKSENVRLQKEMNTKKTRQNMDAVLTEDVQSTSNIKDILARSSLGMSEQLGFASTSEMSSTKGMSQSMIAQSSTSSHQSVAMKLESSSKASELVSDVISAELREAAENV